MKRNRYIIPLRSLEFRVYRELIARYPLPSVRLALTGVLTVIP